MNRLKTLLKDESGESLVELIAAFTVLLLALAALTSMVSVGMKLKRMSADADSAYYSEFEEAAGKITVTIDQDFTEADFGHEVEIPYYQNDAGFICFAMDIPSMPHSSEPSGEALP